MISLELTKNVTTAERVKILYLEHSDLLYFRLNDPSSPPPPRKNKFANTVAYNGQCV